MNVNKRILVLSLLLNMLLGGMVAGRFFHHWIEPSPDFPSWMAEAGLTKEQQTQLQAGLKLAREKSYGRMQEESDRLRKEMLSVLSAPQFDHAAYQLLSDRMLALRQEGRASMAQQIGEMGKGMSQQERAALAHVVRRYAKERDRCRRSM